MWSDFADVTDSPSHSMGLHEFGVQGVRPVVLGIEVSLNGGTLCSRPGLTLWEV